MKKPNYPKRVQSKAHMIVITLIMLVVATVCFYNGIRSTGTAQYAWAGGYIHRMHHWGREGIRLP